MVVAVLVTKIRESLSSPRWVKLIVSVSSGVGRVLDSAHGVTT